MINTLEFETIQAARSTNYREVHVLLNWLIIERILFCFQTLKIYNLQNDRLRKCYSKWTQIK